MLDFDLHSYISVSKEKSKREVRFQKRSLKEKFGFDVKKRSVSEWKGSVSEKFGFHSILIYY